MADRFFIRESTGYRISLSGEVTRRPSTEVMVIDRAYNHKVLWSSWTTEMERRSPYRVWDRRYTVPVLRDKERILRASARRWPVARARAYAEALCEKLSGEYE